MSDDAALTAGHVEATVAPPIEPADEAAPPDDAGGSSSTPEPGMGAPAPSMAPTKRGRFRRSLGRLRGVRIRMPRSRRGILALVLVLGGLGMAAVFTGATLIRWTETADFCGRCHQMGPELAAYESGPHREVACAECHVEPGPVGWVQAKIKGTEQLFEVILGVYPKPIPPPDHADLPPTQDTCQRCHSVAGLAVNQVKVTSQFAEDEKNTKQVVGLMIRPNGGDPFNANRSVHWHVLQDVEYWSADPHTQTIDVVQIHYGGGGSETFIAQKKTTTSDDVQPDIEKLQTADQAHTMSCYDCHNRAGHDIPNPRISVDNEMANQRIDPSLPYIKRESMRLLWVSYPDVATADAAINGLKGFYQLIYPDVAASDGSQIDIAIADLKNLYVETATPEMKVTAATYPNNLGHMDFPGCFRCHDGAHYLVKDGKLTNETIPSSCNTCHTFPQIGGEVATLPLGTPPQTHNDKLYVFDHAKIATSKDPGGQSCGQCHAKDYCEACHSTGAVNVDHEQMLTNHAAVIKSTGNEACAYCHQPPYCAQCHTDQVLPVTGPYWGAQPSPIIPQSSPGTTSKGPTGLVDPGTGATESPAPPGIRWPLVTVALR